MINKVFIKQFKKNNIAMALSTLFVVPSVMATSNDVVNKENQPKAEIETIAVWSTQVKTSSLYLKGEDIANKQADHLSDLLRTIPGVDVGGAHSLNQRITIRSMDDKDLNISIDGATQNSYMFHHMGNLQIHADILKSVDIEIGSNSIVHGGLGGAVRFETKEALDLLKEDQRVGARVQVSVADNSGNNYSLTGYGLITDNIDFLAYFNDVERDNYEVGGNEIKDGEGSVIPGTDGKVRGLKGDIQDALIKFGWNIDNNQRLSLSYENYQDEGNYSFRPDMGLATDLAISQSLEIPLLWPTEFTRDTVTLNYDLSFGAASQLIASVFSNTSELWRDHRGYAENPRFVDDAVIISAEAKNTGVNILAETAIDGLLSAEDSHEFTYGFEYVDYETDYKATYTNDVVLSAETSKQTSLYAEDKIALTKKLSIIPGVRYTHADLESAVVEETFDDILFALAAEYQFNNFLLFKLSSTELFKAPEIGEVFIGAGLNDRQNSNIKEETGVNTEFAFAYQDKVLGADLFAFGATVFKTDIDNYIYDYASVPDGSGDRWKANVGDIEITGAEIYVGYQLGNFDSQLTYSSSESELDAFSDYQYIDGARIDREQGDTISASVGYQFSSVDLSLHWEIQHVGDLSADVDLGGASADNSKDSFTVNNLSANWSPSLIEGLTLLLGVDNVFDEYYASQSSRTGLSFHPRFGDLLLTDYEPGRNIKATMSYQF